MRTNRGNISLSNHVGSNKLIGSIDFPGIGKCRKTKCSNAWRKYKGEEEQTTRRYIKRYYK